MLTIKNITIKNFMSVGNVTQAVHFNTQPLTLVLGINVDLGGDDNRNGTGKTTIVNALSYALYGQALTNIRKDNLINKTNNRHMLVTVDFEKDGNNYRIERGRRPNKFTFLVNDNEQQESTDEMQGEGRLGQEQIVRILGLSHTMFKHVIALNTYTEPFLSMRANDQREVIEQLLGITQLSEKAALLKELVKTTKESIMGEEYRIKAVESANKKIEDSIKDLERRSSIWLRRLEEDIQVCTEGITELQKIDTEEELNNHALLTEYKEKQNTITNIETEQVSLVTQENREETRLTQANKDLEATKEHKCYACGQELHDEAHKKILLEKETTIIENKQHITKLQTSFKLLTTQRQEIGELGIKPEVNYDSIHDVYDHKNTLENLIQQLENKNNDENPYVDQIDTLKKKGLQEVDWEEVNELNRLLDHQEFLLKLLTNKDSFIRKRIIEQNLNYLNHRLEYYLSRLGLPHEVSFQSDLNVEITELGRSLDFDNLSRGERNRLILGLSWAFRDVFESLNHPINLLAIDELIDSGMDTNGVENSLSVLKKISRERKKNVFLISHRDELVGRVNTILYVIKENGFTSFSTDVEQLTV